MEQTMEVSLFDGNLQFVFFVNSYFYNISIPTINTKIVMSSWILFFLNKEKTKISNFYK